LLIDGNHLNLGKEFEKKFADLTNPKIQKERLKFYTSPGGHKIGYRTKLRVLSISVKNGSSDCTSEAYLKEAALVQEVALEVTWEAYKPDLSFDTYKGKYDTVLI
jgi:hypothetical protein